MKSDDLRFKASDALDKRTGYVRLRSAERVVLDTCRGYASRHEGASLRKASPYLNALLAARQPLPSTVAMKIVHPLPPGWDPIQAYPRCASTRDIHRTPIHLYTGLRFSRDDDSLTRKPWRQTLYEGTLPGGEGLSTRPCATPEPMPSGLQPGSHRSAANSPEPSRRR